jgi:hypothetical protein
LVVRVIFLLLRVRVTILEGPRKVSFVVTNRTEAKRYDAVWPRTLDVQDTGAVVYVAQAGRKFLRVTHPIE